MSNSPTWRFWIDVGGTFTDCLAISPEGQERFTKVLSSGLVKGTIDQVVDENSFIDSAQIGIDQFWRDVDIHLLSAAGEELAQARVVRFEPATGRFQLDHGVFNQSGPQPAKYELDCGFPAPVLAMHLIQGVPANQPLADCQVDLGTTRGTNALLTRTGARTALVTSYGFQDFLRIGDQARPKLFELRIKKLQPLFETAIEINERVLSDGTVEREPDAVTVERQLRELMEQRIESLAICLMFGYKFPRHEELVAQIATDIGFSSVCRSSVVAPLIKIVPRGETTVLDAYLNPVIASYLDEFRSQLSAGSQLRFMTSGGGLVSRARFSGKDSVLSGPAGGVVGAARIAEQAGFQQVIGFDMGGTSTDVSRYDGRFERTFETRKAGVRIVTPMLEVETVAAGGGSVCWFDGTKLQVGPASAGADPGPACYGRGGPLAITDINLFLGRLRRDLFPFELDFAAVENRLQSLCDKLATAGHHYSPHELAAGFFRIANHNMSAAIQTVSVAKGYDPRDYVLMSFGGAGSQHCCAVAENLGMTRILDHPQGSILSAVGIRLADQSAHAVESILKVFGAETIANLEEVFDRLTQQVIALLVADGNDRDGIRISRTLDLRYVGTEPSLSIVQSETEDFLTAFYRKHQQHYGYLQQRDVEIVAARCDGIVAGNRLTPLSIPQSFKARSKNESESLWYEGSVVRASTWDRAELGSGDLIVGPALIADRHSTTIVDTGWQAKVLPGEILLLESVQTAKQDPGVDRSSNEHADPVRLEIFNNHFSSIAHQMGVVLQKTSVSVNVKERLDFSCAIFTNTGNLVVNAPHIPVHLGAMSETVRTIIKLNPDVQNGDVFVTNDPFAGGSHLPDVTVITPVFDSESGTQLWFWVASRSHHAEIGGCAPGSMPAGATCLAEEGVLIRNFRLIEGAGTRGSPDVGVSPTRRENFAELHELLLTGPYPSRSPAENLADIRAQVAANQAGLNGLLKLVDQYSIQTVLAYMEHIQAAAEQKARHALSQLADGEFHFSDKLDNGATIRVQLSKHGDELTVDFSGTDPVLPDNLNANRAIVASAIMYVMRLLISEDIPLNEGVMNVVTIKLPACFLNPAPAPEPGECPAVVGGNVETSQRLVDVLLGALQAAAASQGTMNNWLMGSSSFGYYETIGGGSGATAAGRGADAVHCHMTNTRLTDPEVLETRYPVVLREFSIRRGSGGAGCHRGGDGMIREIEFRTELTVSLLTSRRVNSPYGMQGGMPGATGLNQLLRDGQPPRELDSRCEIQVKPGDRLRIETPGGGGWGQIES
jgi:5-oxoprolinase (ATP-hydrolysing)